MREINIEEIKREIQSDQHLLTAFTLRRDDDECLYMIYGDYEIDTVEEFDSIRVDCSNPSNKLTFPYPELYEKKLEGYKVNLTTKEISPIDYKDLGIRWVGEPFTIYDVALAACAAYTQKNEECSIHYLEENLKCALDSPVYEKAIMNGREIPLRMLNSDMEVMQLLMATDKYLYYSHDDFYMMVGADTLETISNNYFAEVGFEYSLEAIQNGEEKLIWIYPNGEKDHGIEKFISKDTDGCGNKSHENIDYKKLSNNKNVESQRTKENTIEQK